jgi:hypothetical protein
MTITATSGNPWPSAELDVWIQVNMCGTGKKPARPQGRQASVNPRRLPAEGHYAAAGDVADEERRASI